MLAPFVLIHALIFLGCTIASIKALRPCCLAPGEVMLPGLLPNEKRYLYILLPGIALFFIAGVTFAYLLMLPFALQFLFTFGADIAQPLPSIGSGAP